MTENKYLDRAENLLNQVEALLEVEELETERSGNVLTIIFDDDSKIILSLQVAMQEVWIAAKSGGFHFKWDPPVWRDTRSAKDFWLQLSEAVSEQAQRKILLEDHS